MGVHYSIKEKLIKAGYDLTSWSAEFLGYLDKFEVQEDYFLIPAGKKYHPKNGEKLFVMGQNVISGIPQQELFLFSYNETNSFVIQEKEWPVFAHYNKIKVLKWECDHFYELGDPYCPVCDIFHRYVYELKSR